MDNLEKIYKEVAEDMGLSKRLIKSIAEAQFSFIAKTIREKILTTVRLQFWGAFKVKPARLKHLSNVTKDIMKEKLNTKIDGLNKFL